MLVNYLRSQVRHRAGIHAGPARRRQASHAGMRVHAASCGREDRRRLRCKGAEGLAAHAGDAFQGDNERRRRRSPKAAQARARVQSAKRDTPLDKRHLLRLGLRLAYAPEGRLQESLRQDHGRMALRLLKREGLSPTEIWAYQRFLTFTTNLRIVRGPSVERPGACAPPHGKKMANSSGLSVHGSPFALNRT